MDAELQRELAGPEGVDKTFKRIEEALHAARVELAYGPQQVIRRALVDLAIAKGPEEWIKDHIHRYFTALYGPDYYYQAPETFQHPLERWMFGVAANHGEFANKGIVEIEGRMKQLREEGVA